MRKTYVIDTNILIQAPKAFTCFEENRIVIPMVVLEELDRLKRQMEKLGFMQEK